MSFREFIVEDASFKKKKRKKEVDNFTNFVFCRVQVSLAICGQVKFVYLGYQNCKMRHKLGKNCEFYLVVFPVFCSANGQNNNEDNL
jgi:hypothetical protein